MTTNQPLMTNNRKLHYSALIVLLYCFFITSSLLAQTEKIAFKTFGIPEGLPEEWARVILQDEQGFIWIGTQNGLVKYDGYDFKVYKGASKTQDKNIPIGNSISSLINGRDDKLWLTSDTGLSSFDPKTEQFNQFTIKDKETDSLATAAWLSVLFEDSRQNTWMLKYPSNTNESAIVRLDQKTKKTYTYPHTIRSPRFNDVVLNFSLLEAKADSTVWQLTETGDLNRFNASKAVFEKIIDSSMAIPGTKIIDRISSISPTKSDYFILTSEKGIYLWNPITAKSIGTYANITGKEQIFKAPIVYAFEDSKGHIWVIQLDDNFSVIDPKTDAITHYKYGVGKLNFKENLQKIDWLAIFTHNEKGIWFSIVTGWTPASSPGTPISFMFYNYTEATFTYYNEDFNDEKNTMPTGKTFTDYSYFIDKSNLLWLGTRPNLYKQDPKKRLLNLYKTEKTDVNSLHNNSVTTLFEDSQNHLWIGTRDGITQNVGEGKFKEFYWDTATSKNKRLGYINKIIEDRKGSIWVGTSNKGLFRWNESSQKFDNITFNKTVNSITDLIEDAEGNLWISSYNKGIYVLDGNSGKIIDEFTAETSEKHNLISNRIRYMFLDSRGTVWLGDRDDGTNGVFKFKKKEKRFKHYNYNPADPLSLSNNEVLDIAEDDLGRVWVATDEGSVNLYDYEKDAFYQHSDTYDLESTAIIAPAGNGQLWALTYSGGGLALVGPGLSDVEFFGESKGLLHNDISTGDIITDDFGQLWLPTERGLSVFNTKSQTYINYNTEDGFQNYPTNRTVFVLKTHDGDIWMGSSEGNGLNRVTPKNLLIKDSIAPNIVISKMTIMDSVYSKPDGVIFKKAVSYTDAITLSYNQKDLSFEFVALHYLRSENNQYSWKLENYDKNWTTPSKERRAAYTNLSPGTYTFHVKASNADGVWNEEGASITVVINSPWWQTWWAYLMYALIALLIGLKIHKSQRERTLRLEREKVQKKELEQAKEIEKAYTELKSTQTQLIHAEKMASLGELTAGIAHEIQNPLNFVNNFSEVNQELADELIEELDKGDIEESKALAKDIKSNEEKINHHGKRADSIVKGMLKHSRNHTGEKLPTNINSLCDEYLRLAYHGLRAKDKSFNATLETHFDENVGEISVVPQEIGRVVLNIINNGLFAVKEKQSDSNDDAYKPTIWVSTKASKNKILITIRDNGNGIPDAIKDKIFQPFFTTKASGDGTGLGLSMSYDIIKAHNGELQVESEDKKGSTFIVSLPKK